MIPVNQWKPCFVFTYWSSAAVSCVSVGTGGVKPYLRGPPWGVILTGWQMVGILPSLSVGHVQMVLNIRCYTPHPSTQLCCPAAPFRSCACVPSDHPPPMLSMWNISKTCDLKFRDHSGINSYRDCDISHITPQKLIHPVPSRPTSWFLFACLFVLAKDPPPQVWNSCQEEQGSWTTHRPRAILPCQDCAGWTCWVCNYSVCAFISASTASATPFWNVRDNMLRSLKDVEEGTISISIWLKLPQSAAGWANWPQMSHNLSSQKVTQFSQTL